MVREQALAGKVAIVSGSAWGIGAAILCNYPWSARAEDMERVLSAIREYGEVAATDCFAVEADLSTVDGPQHLVNETIKRIGAKKIDILINNAGIAIMKPMSEMNLKQWDKQVNLNVRGMLLLNQAVLPHLAKGSRIINTSSSGARQGLAGATIYCGTKAMVEAFTRCWVVECGRGYECTVNAICPGPTNTHGFNHAGREFLAKLQPLMDATPAGARVAEPEEIVAVVGFLSEDTARWVTEVCISVTGGYHLVGVNVITL
ncbi:short chain type dehydrogenase [Xylogone sp. PMI_703]|nr:short chain type dehydrogenase [Xylogone sp. PMI_703]